MTIACDYCESADYCLLVNEWVWLRSQVCLLRLEVDLGSVVEAEFGQKWRYVKGYFVVHVLFCLSI